MSTTMIHLNTINTTVKVGVQPDFVKADAAFFDAVLAEVRRRRPPKTAIGKLYQDVKTWNRIRRERKDISLIIKRGEESWSFLKLKGGRTLDLSDFDEDWKLEMIEEYLMMPTRPRRHFWMPKNH